MCDFVQIWDEIHNRLLILISRNAFKTSCVSVGDPIHDLLIDPNETCLIVGDERGYAMHILGLTKEQMEGNDTLIKINGQPFRRSWGWRPEEIFIAGRTDLTVKEPSIGTAGIDLIKPGPHYGKIILDDPETDKNTETDVGVEKLWKNYRVLTPLLRRPTKNRRGGRMIIIGTPYSLLGIYHRIMENKAEARRFKFMLGQARKETGLLPKVESDRPPVCLPDGPEGTYLMPDILTKELLDDEFDKDPVWASGQYQISLISKGATEFEKEWFRYYVKKELPGRLKIYILLDPAISLKRTADYTCIMVVGQDELNNIFILKLIHDRVAPDFIIDAFYKLYLEYRPVIKMGIETNGFQYLLKWEFDKEAKKRGRLPIFEVPHYGDKSKKSRIRALITPYKEGRVWHLAADEDKHRVHPTQRVLESQLIQWNPDKKSHDHAPDTLAMFLEISQPRKKKKSAGSSRYSPIDSRTGW